DYLAAAKIWVDQGAVVRDGDVVAAIAQTFGHRCRHLALEINALAFDPAPAGRVEAGLRVHSVVDLVDDHLEVALGLHRSAHDAEGAHGAVTLGEEAGD